MPLCERTRYQKQASTVRNMRAVLKKASWGTRRISKARRTADSTDCEQPPAHRTHLQCAKRPPLGGEQT